MGDGRVRFPGEKSRFPSASSGQALTGLSARSEMTKVSSWGGSCEVCKSLVLRQIDVSGDGLEKSQRKRLHIV